MLPIGKAVAPVAPAAAPTAAPTIVSPTTAPSKPWEVQTRRQYVANDSPPVTEDKKEEGQRAMTLEEQQETAFKLVAFFLMLIPACFLLLYIYHRCSQSRVSSYREKKTL